MNATRTIRRLVLALAFGSGLALAAEENNSESCAVCHEVEAKDWQASGHARSVSATFLSQWERLGKKWECLVCHTSHFDRKTGDFSHEGVGCESCHGATKESHPDDKVKGKMALPVNSEVCQSCHSVTYGEWRISSHGQKNIRCFDCHKFHQVRLRTEDPDQMCGSCHTERLKSFSHATHSVEGLHCLSCHMPEVKGSVTKIRGIGVRGHTFGVGAETCANCHREMVHASHERESLSEEVASLKAATPEKLRARAKELEIETVKLRGMVSANRRVFPPLVALSFLLGIFLGFALPRLRSKTPGEPEMRKPPETLEKTEKLETLEIPKP